MQINLAFFFFKCPFWDGWYLCRSQQGRIAYPASIPPTPIQSSTQSHNIPQFPSTHQQHFIGCFNLFLSGQEDQDVSLGLRHMDLENGHHRCIQVVRFWRLQQSKSTAGHHWSNSLCQQLVTTGATVHVNNWSPLEQQFVSTAGHHWSNSPCQQLVTTEATVCVNSWSPLEQQSVNSWSPLKQQFVSTAGHHWSNSLCQQLVTTGATVCVNSWSPLEQQSMSTTGHHWSNSLCQQLVTTGATVCQQLVTTRATVNQLSWEQTSRSVVISAAVGQLWVQQ